MEAKRICSPARRICSSMTCYNSYKPSIHAAPLGVHAAAFLASIPSLRGIGTKVYQSCEMPSSSISGLVQDRTRDPSQISRRVADNERVSARHCNEHPARATGRTCPNGESTLQRTADILKRLSKAKHDREATMRPLQQHNGRRARIRPPQG